jgi:hypothetical protein
MFIYYNQVKILIFTVLVKKILITLNPIEPVSWHIFFLNKFTLKVNYSKTFQKRIPVPRNDLHFFYPGKGFLRLDENRYDKMIFSGEVWGWKKVFKE